MRCRANPASDASPQLPWSGYYNPSSTPWSTQSNSVMPSFGTSLTGELQQLLSCHANWNDSKVETMRGLRRFRFGWCAGWNNAQIEAACGFQRFVGFNDDWIVAWVEMMRGLIERMRGLKIYACGSQHPALRAALWTKWVHVVLSILLHLLSKRSLFTCWRVALKPPCPCCCRWTDDTIFFFSASELNDIDWISIGNTL